MKKLFVIILVLMFTTSCSLVLVNKNNNESRLVQLYPSNLVMFTVEMINKNNFEYLHKSIKVDDYANNLSLIECYLFIDNYSPNSSILTLQLLDLLKAQKNIVADRKNKKIDEINFINQVEAFNINITGVLANQAVKQQLE